MLSTLAKVVAHSTRIVGYRGAGRLFKPFSQLEPFLSTQGTTPLGRNAKITFPAFDPYWAQYLWTGKTYEPDVDAIFRALAEVPDKVFVDCGANIGYWTTKLSDPRYGFRSFFAVEANPYVFGYLKRNVESNRIPARLLHAAIAERSGETVHIDCTRGHAVGRVGGHGTPVQTVNIASILGTLATSGSEKRPLVVVKLDVEGSEIAAIKGAAAVESELDFLFVYEDWPSHGMPVSAFLLSNGYSVVGVHADGRREALTSVDAILDFNRRSFRGHHPSNLVGMKNPALFTAGK